MLKLFSDITKEQSDIPSKNGWASGWYHCQCRRCETEYMGQKGSWECSTCAYDETIDRSFPSKEQIEDYKSRLVEAFNRKHL